jgi:taurine dioxygenase
MLSDTTDECQPRFAALPAREGGRIDLDHTALTERLGAVVHDLDVRTIDEPIRAQLCVLLERHGVLCFRRQSLTDRELYEFSRKIGALEESARRISHSNQISQVANLTNLLAPDGSHLGFPGTSTDFWHSDQEFREHPATLATLYCLIASPSGGTTSFACTGLRHLGLDAETVERMRGLWSCYAPAPTHDNAPMLEVAHPALLRSPLSGHETAYVSENTRRFLGLDAEAGAQLKAALLARILRPENIYSHAWQAGDLILYDNTQVLHRRDAYEGPRWLKATKIFADPSFLTVPPGRATGVPLSPPEPPHDPAKASTRHG